MLQSIEVKRVLLCEDEAITILALREILTEMGHLVVGQENDGEKVVALAQQLQPDLILMDMGLSGFLSGVQAAREILQEQTVPIVMLSAYGDDEHIHAAMQAGAHGYLVKPITSEQLEFAITAALVNFDATQAAMQAAESTQQTYEPTSALAS